MLRFLSGALSLLMGVCLSVRAASDNQPFGGKGIPVKGFKLAEPYGPPYEGQTKSKLEGGKALVLPSGSALLSDGVILHTYSETNTLQLIVKADECFYNSTNHVIHSAGPIHMETADGKFTIEGMGFFWQTNSSLIISNQVHTAIQAALLRAAATNRESMGSVEQGPLFIDSTSFSYDSLTGKGVWRDKVRVTGTNLVLNSTVLTADVPMKEGQLRALLAERDVTVRYNGIYATGGSLNYAPDTGLIRLLDQATWEAEERKGHGDEIVIDRANHIFQVNRHAGLTLPGQTLGQSTFLSFSNAPAMTDQPMAKSSVDIACDNYEIRSNWAVFRKQVQLEEHVADTVRSRITCQDDMTVTFAGTNELQTLSATRDVVIEEEDKQRDKWSRLTGGRAFYTHTNGLLEMTQNPAWQSGKGRGKGDLVRLNTQLNEMLVRGNAYLRLPANELAAQLTLPTANAQTNRPPRIGTNEFAEIFCEEYLLSTNKSVFRGGVYATHPEWNWSCEKLTVQTLATGTTNLVAEQNVVFSLLNQKSEVHGRGDNAIYSFGNANGGTNDASAVSELRLTGTPAILSGTNGTFQNPLIIWDRAKNKMTLPGSDYRIQGLAKAIDTNIFVLPNKKRKK